VVVLHRRTGRLVGSAKTRLAAATAADVQRRRTDGRQAAGDCRDGTGIGAAQSVPQAPRVARTPQRARVRQPRRGARHRLQQRRTRPGRALATPTAPALDALRVDRRRLRRLAGQISGRRLERRRRPTGRRRGVRQGAGQEDVVARLRRRRQAVSTPEAGALLQRSRDRRQRVQIHGRAVARQSLVATVEGRSNIGRRRVVETVLGRNERVANGGKVGIAASADVRPAVLSMPQCHEAAIRTTGN